MNQLLMTRATTEIMAEPAVRYLTEVPALTAIAAMEAHATANDAELEPT